MSNLPKRKELRLKNYDYSSNGYYFVTICTNNKQPFIEKYKQEVERTLLNLPTRFAGLTLDYYCLMPTHLHIILILENVKVALSRVVRTFKALVTKITGEKTFWQRNYYEHVIRTEKALWKNMRNSSWTIVEQTMRRHKNICWMCGVKRSSGKSSILIWEIA